MYKRREPAAASASDEDEHEEEENGGWGATGAFAALAGLENDEEDEWQTVTSKRSVKKPQPAPAPARGAPAQTRTSTSYASTGTSGRPSGAIVPPPRATVPAGLRQQQSAPFVAPPPAVAPPPPRPRTHDESGRPLSDDYYQSFQRVYRDHKGIVCMRFHKTEVVRVSPDGSVTLTTGGYKTKTTLMSMNDALQHLNITVHTVTHNVMGDWCVSDNAGSNYPYEDGLTLPAKTASDRSRAETLLAAYMGSPRMEGSRAPAGSPGAAAASAAPRRLPPPAAAVAAAPAGARPAVPGAPPQRPPVAYAAAAAGTAPAAPPKPSASHPRDSRGKEAELAQQLHEHLALAGDDLDEDHACIVCMARERDTIVIPCGHMLLCSQCVSQQYGGSVSTCPLCAQEVFSHVTIDL